MINDNFLVLTNTIGWLYQTLWSSKTGNLNIYKNGIQKCFSMLMCLLPSEKKFHRPKFSGGGEKNWILLNFCFLQYKFLPYLKILIRARIFHIPRSKIPIFACFLSKPDWTNYPSKDSALSRHLWQVRHVLPVTWSQDRAKSWMWSQVNSWIE